MLLVAIIAIPLGWKVNKVRHQRMVVAEIERLNGHFSYDHQWPSSSPPRAPAWVRRAMGEDFFSDIVEVGIDTPQVTDDTLALLATLPQLDCLVVDSVQITDEGLSSLARSSRLTGLWIKSARITDDGLARLTALKNLKVLYLSEVPITDSGLGRLHRMSSLREISLENIGISPDCIDNLCRALPDCLISIGSTSEEETKAAHGPTRPGSVMPKMGAVWRIK
jgi:hypothetical protein